MGYQPRITVLCGDGEEKSKNSQLKAMTDLILYLLTQRKAIISVFLMRHRKSVCAENAVIVSDNVLFQRRVASDIYDPAAKYKTNIRKMREFLDYITDLPDAETSIAAVGDGLAITPVSVRKIM